jgi:transposase
MYITVIPNRNSPPAILLRESFREEGVVKNRTLANLSDWAPERIEAFKVLLKGGTPVTGAEPEVVASLAHGHVAAVLGMVRALEVDKLLHGRRHRMRELTLALVAGRILEPSSKLALAQGLQAGAEHSTLGSELGLGEVDENEFYEAMDWLVERQPRIEAALAKRHLGEGCMVLYDLSSSYFEGHCCPLAQYGHSRDKREDRPQINYGLLCNVEGVPIAIDVVEGKVGDPKTIPDQVEKLKERFGLKRVVVVGDRGMVTEARIRQDVQEAGYDWITALRHASIQPMVNKRVIQPSLFDERGLAEITHPDYPGERLIACFNPFMKEERARKREALLQLTEAGLAKVAANCERPRKPLEGKGEIGLKAGAVLSKFKMGKYFKVRVGDYSLGYFRNQELLDQEAALDGIYVIRTSVPKAELSDQEAVLAYKRLAKVERAFRTMKSVDLQVRPIFHHLERRVKAHLFICMLAYYVEFHLRQAWQELLYHDEGGSQRKTPVAPVSPSAEGKAKKATGRSKDGLPLQTFAGLLKSLASLSRSQVRLGADGPTYARTTKPTSLQARALELIGLKEA